MIIEEALLKRRTIRLYQQKPVPKEDLRFMIDAARQTSCASNLQRLRFVVVTTPSTVQEMLAKTAWAGLVKPRRTPVSGVTGPAAFIAVTVPENANSIVAADAGAAIQSMQLAAWSKGLGCCWIASIDKAAMKQILQVPEGREVMFVVSVGYPAESPCSEDVHSVDKVAYYLDDSNRLHVPKLAVEEISTWK
ncbi:MAG: nitroreductase family protein [Victivallales bacterium]|nr:nitroreductase family protein [Victivallales bacterium]